MLLSTLAGLTAKAAIGLLATASGRLDGRSSMQVQNDERNGDEKVRFGTVFDDSA